MRPDLVRAKMTPRFQRMLDLWQQKGYYRLHLGGPSHTQTEQKYCSQPRCKSTTATKKGHSLSSKTKSSTCSVKELCQSAGPAVKPSLRVIPQEKPNPPITKKKLTTFKASAIQKATKLSHFHWRRSGSTNSQEGVSIFREQFCDLRILCVVGTCNKR